MPDQKYWVNPKATPEGLWGGIGTAVPAGMKEVSKGEQQVSYANLEKQRTGNYGGYGIPISSGTTVAINPVPEQNEIPAKQVTEVTPSQVTTKIIGTHGTVMDTRVQNAPTNQVYDAEAMKQQAKAQQMVVTETGNKTIVTQPIDYTYQWREKEIGGSAGFTELFSKRMEEEQLKQEKEMVAKFGSNWRMQTVSPGVAEVAGVITKEQRKEAEETGGMFVVPPETLKASAIAKEKGEPIPIIQEYQFPQQAKRMEDISKALIAPVTTKEETLLSKVGLGENVGEETATGGIKTYGRSLAKMGRSFLLPVETGVVFEQAIQTAVTQPKQFKEIMIAGGKEARKQILNIPNLFKKEPIQTTAKALAVATPFILAGAYQGYKWLKWRREQPVTTFTEVATPSGEQTEVTGTAITKFGSKEYQTAYGGASKVKDVAGDITKGTSATKLITTEIGKPSEDIVTISGGKWVSKLAKETPDYNLLSQEGVNKFVSSSSKEISTGFQAGKYAVKDYGDLQATIGKTLTTGAKGENVLPGNIGGFTRIVQPSEPGYSFTPGLKIQTSTGTASALEQLGAGIKTMNKPTFTIPQTLRLTGGIKTSTPSTAIKSIQAPMLAQAFPTAKAVATKQMKPITTMFKTQPSQAQPSMKLSTPSMIEPIAPEALKISEPTPSIISVPESGYSSRVVTIQPKYVLAQRVIRREPELTEEQQRSLYLSQLQKQPQQIAKGQTSSLMKSLVPQQTQQPLTAQQQKQYQREMQFQAMKQISLQRVANRSFLRAVTPSFIPGNVIGVPKFRGSLDTGVSGKSKSRFQFYNYFEKFNPVATSPKEISRVFNLGGR